MRALRLTILAFVVLDLVTSVIAHAYGAVRVGPTSLAAIAQSLLVLAAIAAAMWVRPRVAVALSAVSLTLVFAVGPTGSELYLLAVTAVMTAALAAPRFVVVLLVAQIAYAVAYGMADGPSGDWASTLTLLAVAAVGDGIGLAARRLIAARDRRRREVRLIERQNAEIRASERRRLADDLQTLVTRDLAEIEAQVAALGSTTTPAELRHGLSRIQEVSSALLGELRVLLEVLRRDLPLDEPTAAAAGGRLRWVDRLRSRDVRIAVSGISSLLVVRALLVTGPTWSDPDLWVQCLGLIACALAVWRPRVAVVVALTAVTLSVAWSAPAMWDTLSVALLCVIAALRWRGPRFWLIVGAVLVYGGLLALTVPTEPSRRVILELVIGLVSIVAGTFSRYLVDARSESHRELMRLLADRRRLAALERSEVARELHDIVAHQLSATSMAIMATSASEDAAELLESLARVGRRTQAAGRELKVLLSSMRSSEVDLPDPTPLVTPLTCARALEQQLIEDGFCPVVTVDPAADRLDLATQRTISRIMQEATTNIARYAPPGSTAELWLAVEGRHTMLEISSQLVPDGATSDLSLGWGLRGLRERVDLSRGTFSAGPSGDQWVVSVRLPDLTAAVPPVALAS